MSQHRGLSEDRQSVGRFVWCRLHGGAAFGAEDDGDSGFGDDAAFSLAERVVAAVRQRHPHLHVVCDPVEVVPGVRMLGIGGGTEEERLAAAQYARRYVSCLVYRRSR